MTTRCGLRGFAAVLAMSGLLAGLACAGGCVTETVPAGKAGEQRKVKVSGDVPPEIRDDRSGQIGDVRPGAGAVSDGRAELDTITANDPCGNRMHALAGAMLMYYAVHRQLPPTLESLRAAVGDDPLEPPFEFTCPTTGHEYVYDPVGLVQRGSEGRIVLYDDEPSHGGGRWCVVASPPRGMRPPTASAVRLSEANFRRYAPAPPVPPAAPPQAP